MLALARSKLKIKVKVETLAVPEIVIPGFGSVPAATDSNDDASQHTVRYTTAADESTLLHEFCHVKLNEIGFKTAELRLPNQGRTPPELSRAVRYVAEVYADCLLFRHFRDESKSMIQALDGRFLVTEAIRIIVRELPKRGIIVAAGHRVSKRWSGYDQDDAFRFAFEEAFKGKKRVAYTEIHTIMSRLPMINENAGVIQNFTNPEIDTIQACILELSKNIEKRKL
jgi:hypothetical protein